jgi:hypothetical protein
LLAPLIVLALALYLGYGLVLLFAIWLRWLPRGKRLLFVYSDSPLWKEHLQAQLLPRLEPQAFVLNWSQRRQWPRGSLPVLAFAYFGGHREFNPLAVVFAPGRLPKVFRFWRPFQALKHGDAAPLARMEAELLEWLQSGDARGDRNARG